MSHDIFIKLDGIPGESADKKHEKEIAVQSVSWGESQVGTFGQGGGGGAGKVQFQDIHFTKSMDIASHLLFLHCCQGKHIPSATITFRKAGTDQQEFLVITLKDVLITSVSNSDGAGGGSIPQESVSMQFAEFTMDYKAQKQDGSLGGSNKQGWNLKTNLKI